MKTERATFSLLTMALVMVSLVGVFSWYRMTAPGDGARLIPGENVWRPDGIVVAPLIEEPGGLLAGDLVLAVDGRGMEAWARDLVLAEGSRPHRQVGQVVTYTVLRGGERLDVPVALKPRSVVTPLAAGWSVLLFMFSMQLIATYVLIRRPHEPAARPLFIFAWSSWHLPVWFNGLQVSDIVNRTGFWLYKAATFPQFLLTFIALLHFSLVFPKMHPLVARRRRLFPVLYIAPYLLYLLYLSVTRLAVPGNLDWLARWGPGEWLVTMVCLGLSVSVGIQSHRTGYDAVARQRVRWVLLAAITAGSGLFVLWLLPGALLGQPLIGPSLLGLFGLPFALAVGLAILRHHLFDIDVIINRTLVYGALTSVVIASYALIVSGLGALLQAAGETPRGRDFTLSLVATGTLAVIFQPLRERLQRAVNRLMYGERDDPYAVLARLGRRLEASIASEAILLSIAETVAQALRLPYAAVALRPGDRPAKDFKAGDFEVVAASGSPPDDLLKLPLVYRDEPIGQLLVAHRSPGQPFTRREMQLLQDISHQASLAAHSVRLTIELQRSRQRLVTAREEERRRLRRDLHDGLGPALAAQSLKVGSARTLIRQDPSAAETLLDGLEGDIKAAIADIRRLVYDLRPPALDELGLVAAIRESVAPHHLSGTALGTALGIAPAGTPTDGLRVHVEAPDRMPPLPAAVEVATYRIVQEALTNVVRHAQARNCVIRLSVGDALRLEIYDDGVGLPDCFHAGVGLVSMNERVEELGGSFVIERRAEGGTRLLAEIPLPRIAEAGGEMRAS